MLRKLMRTVADVMTRDIVTVDADATLTAASARMASRRVGAALVFEGDRLPRTRRPPRPR